MSPKNLNGENKKYVFDPLRNVKLVEQLFANDTVETMLVKDFYVIEFNIGCRTRDDIFIPIEVGIVKFNIKDGVKDSFHDFIDPGPVPLGYNATAKDLSDNYHGIPLDSFSNKNYNKFCEYIGETSRTHMENYANSINEAVRRIDKFVQPETVIKEAEAGKPRSSVRPIFSNPLTYEGVFQTDGCLKRLASESNNMSFYESFQAMDIVHLLKFACHLKSEKVDRPYAVFESAFSVKILDPPSKTLCQFHWEIDNFKCALGRAFALTYCFLDHVCPHYPVVPTSKHLPPALDPVVLDQEWQDSIRNIFEKYPERRR